MICAIDFGSCWIRSIFRNPRSADRLSLFAEKSEYTMIRPKREHRDYLTVNRIPFAECDGSLLVPGNASPQARWLSRLPASPLFVEGNVPIDDPPARQILSVITQATLPELTTGSNLCVVIVPGLRNGSEQAGRNEKFLCRLVEMKGYRPVVVNAAEAALLATCGESQFTGISLVMGAETTSLCVSRQGLTLAADSLPFGGNWIDTEIAREFDVKVWDEEGNAYLNLEGVRQWKHTSGMNLPETAGDRERVAARLYSAVIDRVARSIVQMLNLYEVRSALGNERLNIVLSGGSVTVQGFSAALTERMIEHEIADRIRCIRLAPDPQTSVVRGALIFGELEATTQQIEHAA